MEITVQNFIQEFKDRKITNTKIDPDAIQKYIQEKLEIKSYIPFRTKREIAETVVAQNIQKIDGIKRYDSINAYIGLIVATLMAHTSLIFGPDPIADYDMLAESGLLTQIVTEFQESYNEIDILLKMVLTSEMEDNNINVLVGNFLDNILKRFDTIGAVLKDKLEDIDLKDILGVDFNSEDLTKLKGLLNKYIK